MRIVSLAVCLVFACGGDDTTAEPTADAAALDAGLAVYEPSNLSAEDFVERNGVLMVAGAQTVVINTNDLTVENHPMGTGVPRVQEQADDSQIAVFRFVSIEIDGDVEVVGDRMLALVSSGGARVDGQIAFPGGAPLTCGLVTTGVVAGGGGGGFGSVGGTGGNAGGAPGQVRGNDTLVPLATGCAGGPGIGQGTSEGGFGGAAIQISAAGSVAVGGTICASGGGGESVAATGGGGGGSGGAILIEGRDIAVSSGSLIASGGGGGGGGAANVPGEPGATSCTAQPAAGGAAGGLLGGAGGSGGIAAGPGTSGESGVNPAEDPGGGAGGGVGRIRLNTIDGAVPTDAGEFSGTVTQGQLALTD